jgi:hypothetical protein
MADMKCPTEFRLSFRGVVIFLSLMVQGPACGEENVALELKRWQAAGEISELKPPNLARLADQIESKGIAPLFGAVENWSRIDPERCWQGCRDLSPIRRKTELLGVCIREWAAEDPERALQAVHDHWVHRYVDLRSFWAAGSARKSPFTTLLKTLEFNPEERATLSSMLVVNVWARSDCLSALRFVRDLKFTNGRNQRLIESLIAGARHVDGDAFDLETGRALLETAAARLDDVHRRSWAYMVIIRRMAEDDIDSAIELVNAIPPDEGDVHQRCFGWIAEAAAAHDIERAIALLVRCGRYRKAHAGNVAVTWSQREPELAAQWARNERLDANIVSSIGRQWAKSDWRKAIEYADTIKDDRRRDLMVAGILGTCVNSNPAETVEYLKLIRNSSLLRSLSGNYAITLIATDQELAFKALETYPVDPSTNSTDVIFRFGQKLAAVDPAKAKAWAEKLSPDSLRNATCSYMADALAARNPRDAWEWTEFLIRRYPKLDLTFNVARHWCLTEPRMAAETVVNLPPARRGKRPALKAVVKTWFENDPDNLRKWARSISNEQDRKDVIAMIDELGNEC